MLKIELPHLIRDEAGAAKTAGKKQLVQPFDPLGVQ